YKSLFGNDSGSRNRPIAPSERGPCCQESPTACLVCSRNRSTYCPRCQRLLISKPDATPWTTGCQTELLAFQRLLELVARQGGRRERAFENTRRWSITFQTH